MSAADSAVLPATVSVGPAALPSAPWASAGCSSATAPPRLELYLGTHTAVLTHEVESSCWRRLSEGRGHYYGLVPASTALPGAPPGALLVGSQGRLSRPRAGKPAIRFRSAAPRNESSGLPGVTDALLVLDPASRSVLGWWSLPSSYLHDTIYEPDSRALFAVDSDTARVLRLSLDSPPAGPGPTTPGRLPLSPLSARTGHARLALRRSYDSLPGGGSLVPRLLSPMRARAAHANNVAVALGHLWVMHNNMARTSALQLVDLDTGQPRVTLVLGGPNCHNPCFYSGRVLYLLSSSGGLGMLHPNGTSTTLFQAGSGWFSKGLAVVDHVAYFGLAPKQRSGVERNWAASQLAAFALGTGRLLWRRPLPFAGLVNSVSAPGLAPFCSWRACDTKGGGEHLPRQAEWRHLVNG